MFAQKEPYQLWLQSSRERRSFNTSSFCSMSTSWSTIHSMELHGIEGTNGEQGLWGTEKKPKPKPLLTF